MVTQCRTVWHVIHFHYGYTGIVASRSRSFLCSLWLEVLIDFCGFLSANFRLNLIDFAFLLANKLYDFMWVSGILLKWNVFLLTVVFSRLKVCCFLLRHVLFTVSVLCFVWLISYICFILGNAKIERHELLSRGFCFEDAIRVIVLLIRFIYCFLKFKRLLYVLISCTWNCWFNSFFFHQSLYNIILI